MLQFLFRTIAAIAMVGAFWLGILSADHKDYETLETLGLQVVGVLAVLLLFRGVRTALLVLLGAVAAAFCKAGDFIEPPFGGVKLERRSQLLYIVSTGAFLFCFKGPWLRKGRRDRMPRLRFKPFEAEIRKLYMRHNPSKLPQVDTLLEKYRGREAELYERIVDRYEGSGSDGSPGARQRLGGRDEMSWAHVGTASTNSSFDMSPSSSQVNLSFDDDGEDEDDYDPVMRARLSYREEMQKRIQNRLGRS